MSQSSTIKKKGGISAVIDPLLMTGKYTIDEIGKATKKKVGHLSTGTNLKVNVSARIHTWKQWGFKFTVNEKGICKLAKGS